MMNFSVQSNRFAQVIYNIVWIYVKSLHCFDMVGFHKREVSGKSPALKIAKGFHDFGGFGMYCSDE